jgi:hypothetical protein
VDRIELRRACGDKARPEIAQRMQHGLQDTVFTRMRDPDALGKLPEAERKGWQKLWVEVGDMLAKAQGKVHEEK